MKRQMVITLFLTFFGITVAWWPCQAQDLLYGCAKTQKGTFRLVNGPGECLKSEYSVILYGSVPPQNPVPEFNGKVCWSIHQTEDEDGPEEGNLGVAVITIQYLGGKYLVQGYLDNPSRSFYGGFGELAGETIFLTFTGIGDDPLGQEAIIMNAKLDKTSLNGVWWNIRTEFHKSTRLFKQHYDAGTLNRVSCP